MKNKTLIALSTAILFSAVFGVSANADTKFDTNFRIGSDRSISINVNVKAQTNRDNDNNERNDSDDNRGQEIKAALQSRFEDDGNRGSKDTQNGNRGWFNGGFLKDWFGHKGTTTVASVEAYNIRAENIGTSTATLRWNTKTETDAVVQYSTDESFNSNVNTVSGVDGESHAVTLTNLSQGTTYYYRVTSTNDNRDSKTSATFSFKTKTENSNNTRSPIILFSTVISVTENSARVIWITGEPADSKVWVSGNADVSTSGTETAGSGDLTYIHNIKLTGLESATKYYFKFNSTDEDGNTTVSGLESFTTK